jgi:hypothetical protein
VLSGAWSDAALAAAGRAEYVAAFHRYMEIVRETARESRVTLIDHLPRRQRLQQADAQAHRALMHDPQHMNALGNMVFAWDILRALKAEPQADLVTVCAPAIAIRERMDAMAGGWSPSGCTWHSAKRLRRCWRTTWRVSARRPEAGRCDR